MRYGIFTKQIHVEKIVNFLNQYTDIDYIISTNKKEVNSYDYDIGISYCWDWKIDVKGKPWYNYHPGPLPEYDGISSHPAAVKDKVTEYGATLHRMTDEFDKGPIIFKKVFKLDSIPINTNELGCIAHYYLFQLFKETIHLLVNL